MNDWLAELQRLRRDGTAAVLVTVASTKGSAPREPGAKMIVTAGGAHGTIGGGHLEHQAIAIARDLIACGGGGVLRRFPLGASLGQCCGGLVNLLFDPVIAAADWVDTLSTFRRDATPCVLVTAVHGAAYTGKLVVTSDRAIGTLGPELDRQAAEIARELLGSGESARLKQIGTPEAPALLLFEPQRAADFSIVLFGAGHVGRALVHVLAGLPCRITWVDSRDDQFPRDLPANVTTACTDTPTSEVDAATPGSYFLVMTHSHALDQELAEAILARCDFAYFGLIGSVSKRRSFERRMKSRGVPPARLSDMTCPIGVPGISGKEPAAIAVAVAAELLQARERRAVADAAPAQAQARRA
jgi:xanthine dehydrogenase accessory factor